MELLAPAGNLEKLKWAVAYGADAVYFGAEFGSLRSFAGNFTFEEAKEGLDYLHERGKKGYVTLNIYPYSDEFDKLAETAKTLDGYEADAFIVADLGVMQQLKQLNLNADLHISTQANTTNYQAALAYKELGAKRVNLARELSLEKIQDIQQNINGQIETEIFVHGAVCFSYSGRCAISDYLAGYKANHGECKHPCRWKYHLVEELRPNEYMPVFEDDRGLYLFNSKELALFEFVPALKEAGVRSIKIEGRMKSIHYIATVVSFYRRILDGEKISSEKGFELLNRIPNRGYSQGFMKGSVTPDDYSIEDTSSTSETLLIANVTDKTKDGKVVLEIRNKIHAGDCLETLSPDGSIGTVTMDDPLELRNGHAVDFANNSQFVLLDAPLQPYTILRRTPESRVC